MNLTPKNNPHKFKQFLLEEIDLDLGISTLEMS